MKTTRYTFTNSAGNTVSVLADSTKDAVKQVSSDYTPTKAEPVEFVHGAKAQAVADSLAALTGTPWTIKPVNSDWLDTSFYLTRADGLKLFAGFGQYHKPGRATLAYSRPYDTQRSIPSLYENGNRVVDPSITVADTATPERVAAEVVRRLLPEAERVHALALVYLARERAAEDTRQASLTAVCGALGVPVPVIAPGKEATVNVPISGGKGYGHIRIHYGGDVEISLQSIPLARALEALRAFKSI